MDIKLSTKRIEKDLEELKQFTATHGNGCTRLPFTKETRDAAEYLKDVMREAGLEVIEDTAANLIGTRKGKDSSLPAVVVASHYDSVQNGGNFDGIGGVVAGIEIARIMRDKEVQLERDFVVVAFMDEEGMRFGSGYFGSKSILGDITVEETKQLTDKDGISVYQAMLDYGMNPENLGKAKWADGRLGHYIELHIEQGPVLENRNLDVGLVTGIVGIQRYMVTVEGRADHAGTTPMDMRKDAVEIASKVVGQIPDFAREAGEGTVATVGYFESIPGGVNIVAQRVKFSIDIRSMKTELVNQVVDNIKKSLDEETKKYDTSYNIETTLEIEPVELSSEMVDILEESAKNNELTYLRLPSGAGHDALAVAQRIENTVMVFIPSKGGRSHSPDEYTSYDAFAKGVQVMYDLATELANRK